MKALHEIIPDEATIKIISRKSSIRQLSPSNLQKSYWVSLGESGQFDTSFETLDEAVNFIRDEALKIYNDENNEQ